MGLRNLFSRRTLGYIASRGRKTCLAASPETYCYFPVYRNPFLVCDRSIHSCQETIIKCDNVKKTPHGNLAAMADVFFSRFSSPMSERIFEVYQQWYTDEIDSTLEHVFYNVEWELKRGGHEQILSSVMANPSQDLLDDVWRALEQVCSVELEKHVKHQYYEAFPLEVGIRPAVMRRFEIEMDLDGFPEQEFYMELELIREQIRAQQVEDKGDLSEAAQSQGGASSENDYVEGVADKIHETVDVVRQISEPVQDEEFYETAVREYSMLMDTYLKQNRLEDAERLLKKMNNKVIKKTEDIYMTLLRSFAQRGDADGVNKIVVLMESDGSRPSMESCSLLVEVFCRAGDPHAARKHFDHIAKLGKKPGLNLIMNMLVAYEKKELYNDAFDFLMQLENDGLEHGFSTYLEDSFDRMLLVDETEQLLGDIDQLLQKVRKL